MINPLFNIDTDTEQYIYKIICVSSIRGDKLLIQRRNKIQ